MKKSILNICCVTKRDRTRFLAASDGQTTENQPALLLGPHKGDKFKTWIDWKVPNAPFCVGFENGNRITRVGFSSEYVQTILQNGIHKLFNSQNYYSNYDDLKLNPRWRGF